MKKILVLIISILLLSGCSESRPRMLVENYLKKYRSLDSEVLVDMETIIKNENLSREDEEKYRDLLKKQYKDLSYKIIEEEYDNDTSYIKVKVEVYDLYSAALDAALYLENNPSEFTNTSGEYDEKKYISYKLDKMKNMNGRVEYTLVFTVTKENDEYVILQPTENDLRKIHGIYSGNVE